MKKVYDDPTLKYTKGDFPLPKGGISTIIDCSTYTQQQSTETEQDKRLGF
jgi:penicillin-binding protein 1A